MADMTILIPPDRVPDVRASLLHAYAGIADGLHHAAAAFTTGAGDADQVRGHRVELEDAADALDQLGWAHGTPRDAVELTAHPELLSDVLLQTVRDQLEVFERRLVAVSEGIGEPSTARAAFEAVLVSFHLFEQVHGE